MSSLADYRRKRKFGETPEPPPKPQKGGVSRNRFVVQKHDATRLHYDFRLEIDGVLKSWAVPKGPSLNPADKRLAMETEDHPLDYADFEGVIPDGHYGAGPVIVWDSGTFVPQGETSATDQYRRGELKFILHGQKLHGSFVLVKLRRSEGKGKPWLLIKHRDALADPSWKIDAHDGSVISDRTLKEVEQGLSATASTLVEGPQKLEGARKAGIPGTLHPMLATLVDKPFSRPDWLFEIKWDGIRALTWIRHGELELRSRTGRVITHQYPELGELPKRVKAETAILDGEIVALDESGKSNFERLQSRMNVRLITESLRAKVPVTYYIFDLLYYDGYDLRGVTLLERKTLLQNALKFGDPFIYADHQLEKGKELFDLARRQGLEGIIGKRIDSFYSEDRSTDWVKFKITREVDVVVGGYTAPRGSREHFGALLAGLYDGKALSYVGSVGTGFNHNTQSTVYAKLRKLQSARCPFDEVPDTREKAYWVEPNLVARVKYGNWTRERRLRAPVFLGLLPDHRATECQFGTEAPVSSRKALAATNDQTRQTGRAASGRQLAYSTGAAILSTKEQIVAELFRGRAENVIIELDGQQVRLSNLNKVYFPESNYTKRDLIAYYYRTAKLILPFLKDRPLVLRRYPDGIGAKSFFQKDAGDGAPQWMKTITVHSPDKNEDIHYFVANDLPALLYLTNLGCIDHNPWSSRIDDLDHPDYVFFDLDPSEGTSFATVVEVARSVHQKLLACGLKVFLKTSGATGFHLYVPLQRKYGFEQVRMFAEIVGRIVAAEIPKRVTEERIIAKRPRETVLIDAYQNASGRPLTAPYAVRAFPRASVSTPVTARELQRRLQPDHFNIKTIFDRIEKYGDLWADFWKYRQELTPAIEKLERLHQKSE
jgi:bifunctional non-homologous end joining protein LigD